jgi:DNA-binding transcriptional MerR regulator
LIEALREPMVATSPAALPTKPYFRIGEVAELVGVEPHVLRYWEREFRAIRPTKSAKGQRVYSRRDVENLMRVRDLLYQDGFTIAGAKKRLGRGAVDLHAPEPTAPPPLSIEPPPARSHQARPDSEKTREQLRAMRGDIEDFLAELDPPTR